MIRVVAVFGCFVRQDKHTSCKRSLVNRTLAKHITIIIIVIIIITIIIPPKLTD